MRQLSGSEFQIGVTAWGAISGRAFLDFLSEALHVRKEAANGDDRGSVANNRFRFKIMSGAITARSAAMRRLPRQTIVLATLLAFFLMAPIGALASDHADPTDLTDPNANITDLFFFPKGDQYILIFNVRRALTASQPYDLAPYEYRVNFDLTTPTTFDSAEDRARYGGTITTPDRLHPDATITVRLNNDTTLKSITVNGLKNTEKIRTYTGVRDDPFIFPRFFKVNVIAMVMSLPKDAFPVGQHDFMLWGTASKDGAELDHVGRSIRTQLPRFGIINTTPPGDQLKTPHGEQGKSRQTLQLLQGKQGVVLEGGRRSDPAHIPDPQIRSGARRDDLHRSFPGGLPERTAAHRRCRCPDLRVWRLPVAGNILHRRRVATRYDQ